MIYATCIERIRCNNYNKNSAITGYRIQDNHTNKVMYITPEMLKQAIRENFITVTNLKLTSDNKLILTEEMATYVITRGLIRKIDSKKKLAFKTMQRQELENTLLKAKILGLKVTQLDNDVFAINNNRNLTLMLVSHKVFEITDGKELFSKTSFNAIDLRNVVTHRCTNATKMFEQCIAEEINLDNMDTSNICSMQEMFMSCQNLKKIDTTNFNTKNVTNMDFMFHECIKAEIILGNNFKTSKVKSMRSMFFSCHFNKFDLSMFDLHSVTDLSHMFNNASIGEIILDNNIRHVKIADSMFYFFTTKKNLDIYKLNLDKIDSIDKLIAGCTAKSIDFTGVNLSKHKLKYMFSWVVTEKIILKNINTTKVDNMLNLFFNSEIGELDLSDLDTSNVTIMNGMFSGCKIDSLIGLNKLKTDKVKHVKDMFYDSEIDELDLSSFNTNNIESAYNMLTDCNAKHIDLSSFDVTNLLEKQKGQTIIFTYNSKEELNKIIKFPVNTDLKEKLLKCMICIG